MVRPASFGWNPETAPSNHFQAAAASTAGPAGPRAVAEFDAVVDALRAAGVTVHVCNDRPEPACPDAVFPNNWLSLHADGTVVLYPMLARSRRDERRLDLVEALERQGGYRVERLLDLTHHELQGRFLEGTGSVVFDHAGGVAYACLSPRTDVAVLEELCAELGYQPHAFHAADRDGVPVYHTNVLLAIGSSFALVCAPAVAVADREALLERLARGGRRVIVIDHAELGEFAGNVLEVRAADGARVLAISQRALAGLSPQTRAALASCVDRMVAVPVPTIEVLGGGSVRCMLAEVFLPPSDDARLAATLVGAWQLVSWTIEYPADGRVTQPFGPEPEGLLTYTADGYMSAVMQRPGRARLSRNDPQAVSDAEKAAAFAGYLHYAGTWHVAGGCVVHDVALAMNPNLLGTRQVRSVALDDERLVLGAEEALDAPGATRRHRIAWRRAPRVARPGS
jgi:hypothetical protein